MPDSPISATPYEVLGVSSRATVDELRRAYRKRLRETHPDTGGDPKAFHAVQHAWERVGTPAGRAAYDAGTPEESHIAWEARPAARQESRPQARSHGHPGGWRRERYLVLMREWVGRGVELGDPYDPALVRSAPRDIRHLLADALAEETTARALSQLGIGFTVWHDVATGDPEDKIDHVVLGPSGLFALLSEDWGAPVRVRRGELVGEGIDDERPMHSLAIRAKVLARAARVKFTALVIVVPDRDFDEGVAVIGNARGAAHVVVQASRMSQLLRDGVPGSVRPGGTEIFEVRTRLQAAIRFV
ncbi:MAG: DnaJ domain-containing protein [Rhodoglobus sp.]